MSFRILVSFIISVPSETSVPGTNVSKSKHFETFVPGTDVSLGANFSL